MTKKALAAWVPALALAAAGEVAALEQGDWLVRLGLATVDPDASSDTLKLNGAKLAGTEADVGDDTQLGITVVYMLSDNWGVELLASTPFEHDISVKGLPFNDVGETKHLPPTLSALYYFGTGTAFKPYLGAGINYTTFFDEEVSNDYEAALGDASMDLDDSLGLALQAGMDYELNEKWVVNASVRWIDLSTDATITSAAGRVTTEVDIDPWVYQLNVGYKF